MKNLKRIILMVIALFTIGGSVAAYAWWDRLSITNTEDNIVDIGSRLELTILPVVIDPLEAGNLIPESGILKPGDTYEVVLTYTVVFSADIQEELTLEVTVDNILVGGVSNPYGLISAIVSNPGLIQNDEVIVTVTISIDESGLLPADYEAAYLAIAGKSITFDIEFQATR